jgi:imidazolonepropionase-like amidohydrolase
MTTHTITAARLWDGTGTAAIVPPMLRIDDGKVAAVGGPPAGAVRDFPGCTILPGLIDTHVHLIFNAAPTHAEVVAQVTRETDEQLVERALANAAAALRVGITTVRDCGGKGRLVQAARDRLRRGDAVGADVLSCGGPITTRTGHCWWLGHIAEGEDEAGRLAERMLADDADFLKIMLTGGNMTPSSDPFAAQYTPAAATRVADVGRAAGKHTAAHVLSLAGMPAAVAARVRTVEHCNWRHTLERHEFVPEIARRLRDQEQFVGFTMSGFVRRALVPELRTMHFPQLSNLDERFECERRTIDAGVPFTIHSDAGVGLTPIDALAMGVRCAAIELRLTPAEALAAVTRTAAVAIGLTDRGTLTPGQRADLLIVEGDPLSDLSCLEKVRAVMQRGRWIESPMMPLACATAL